MLCPTSLYFGGQACVSEEMLCDGSSDCPKAEDEDAELCYFFRLVSLEPTLMFGFTGTRHLSRGIIVTLKLVSQNSLLLASKAHNMHTLDSGEGLEGAQKLLKLAAKSNTFSSQTAPRFGRWGNFGALTLPLHLRKEMWSSSLLALVHADWSCATLPRTSCCFFFVFRLRSPDTCTKHTCWKIELSDQCSFDSWIVWLIAEGAAGEGARFLLKRCAARAVTSPLPQVFLWVCHTDSTLHLMSDTYHFWVQRIKSLQPTSNALPQKVQFVLPSPVNCSLVFWTCKRKNWQTNEMKQIPMSYSLESHPLETQNCTRVTPCRLNAVAFI